MSPLSGFPRAIEQYAHARQLPGLVMHRLEELLGALPLSLDIAFIVCMLSCPMPVLSQHNLHAEQMFLHAPACASLLMCSKLPGRPRAATPGS